MTFTTGDGSVHQWSTTRKDRDGLLVHDKSWDAEAQAGYCYLYPWGSARGPVKTVLVDDLMVDLDPDGKPIGYETLGRPPVDTDTVKVLQWALWPPDGE